MIVTNVSGPGEHGGRGPNGQKWSGSLARIADPAPAEPLTADQEADPATGQLPAIPAVVPAVVAVMVTHDPGPWLEESLATFAAQTYPDLSLLVVDTASEQDPSDRIRAAVPLAHIHRLDHDPGFGAAANLVTDLVEGASFYAVCHDDVALEPDTIRSMVEEAFRSNAGVVGPKLVNWDDPRRLLQVGMSADKTGVQSPLAERGELDQEQHDAVRDVFVVPGGFTLVRADLFDALGGFDEGIDFLGEDLDLCWRAHLLGARVLIVPAARVRHRESLAERRPEDRPRRRIARHRLRTMLTAYGLFHRLRVVPQAALFSLIEVVYALVTGHPERARDVGAAWTWNARRYGQIRRRRRDLVKVRRVSDKEVRAFQARGSARFATFIRTRVTDPEDRVNDFARSSRDVAGAMRSGSRQVTVGFAVILALVLIVSSRDLIFGGIPAIGEFARFPDAPGDLFRAWWSGWRRPGLGGAGAQPTAYALLGLASTLSFGAMGFLRALLILATVPIGAIGAWRLARPIGSARASVAAFAVYLAIPVPYNALASGSWSGLALYALSPWLLLMLGLASGLAPFGPDRAASTERAATRSRRRMVPVTLGLGLALGAVGAFVPFAVPLAGAMAIALALGGVVCFRLAGALRLVVTGLGACLVAVALNASWAIELVSGRSPWDTLAGNGPASGGSLPLGRILRFETGPWGAPPLGWAFLLAGALPVIIGRSWRLEWAVRAWLVVLGGWALLWTSQEGHLPFALPAPETVLAPVAAALALTAALGLASFETDLRAYRFGWRQLLSVVAALGVALGAVPLASGLIDGRWRTPERGFSSSLDPLLAEPGAPAARVLWLGDADVLPVDGWGYDDQVSYAATDRGSITVLDRFVGPPPGPTELLADSLRLAETRRTNRLGHLLAPMGVEYIVIPTRLGPDQTDAHDQRPLSPALAETLDQQLDLEQVPLRDGVVVYRNVASAPARSVLPDRDGDRTRFTEAIGDDLTGALPALSDDRGAVGAVGQVPAEGDLLVATGSDPNWQLRIGGVPMARSKTYGWANQFAATRTGDAELRYDTPIGRHVAAGGQVVLWGAVIFVRRRSRRRERRAGELPSTAPSTRSTTDAAVSEPVPVPVPVPEPEPGPDLDVEPESESLTESDVLIEVEGDAEVEPEPEASAEAPFEPDQDGPDAADPVPEEDR